MAIAYVEIPVRDYDRAVDFYETVFGYTVGASPVGEYQYGVLYDGEDEIGGLVATDSVPYGEPPTDVSYRPDGDAGVLVYFRLTDPLEAYLTRVSAEGGSILVEPPSSGVDVSLGIIHDSEGNRIGLLSA